MYSQVARPGSRATRKLVSKLVPGVASVPSSSWTLTRAPSHRRRRSSGRADTAGHPGRAARSSRSGGPCPCTPLGARKPPPRTLFLSCPTALGTAERECPRDLDGITGPGDGGHGDVRASRPAAGPQGGLMARPGRRQSLGRAGPRNEHRSGGGQNSGGQGGGGQGGGRQGPVHVPDSMLAPAEPRATDAINELFSLCACPHRERAR